MGIAVCAGAMTQCSFGVAPAALNVLPVKRLLSGGPPMANILDNVPMVNILPFGMCTSLANPMVAAATAAALGVLDADAVHPGDDGAVGARFADGDGRWRAGADRQFDVHVRLRGRHQDPSFRASSPFMVP